MSRKILLWIAVFLLALPFNICWRAYAEELELKIYDCDEVATYYYEPKRKIFLTKDIVRVWVEIVAKDRSLGLPKQILGEEYSYNGIDFSDLEMIQAPIEINCLKKRYRVIGGVFYGREATTISEPPKEFVNEDFVKWMDIPSKSAIEKLSKIVCP